MVSAADSILEDFYHTLSTKNVSPFAEHGVGIIKKRYLNLMYKSEHLKIFNFLKQQLDPDTLFFPEGFMKQDTP